MCNGFSGEYCTAEQWYGYMGSTSNGIAPIDIKFVILDNNTEGIGLFYQITNRPVESRLYINFNT